MFKAVYFSWLKFKSLKLFSKMYIFPKRPPQTQKKMRKVKLYLWANTILFFFAKKLYICFSKTLGTSQKRYFVWFSLICVLPPYSMRKIYWFPVLWILLKHAFQRPLGITPASFKFHVNILLGQAIALFPSFSHHKYMSHGAHVIY